MKIKTTTWVAIGVFLSFIVLPLMLIGLPLFGMAYISLTAMSVVAFAFAVILPITQKRLSIYSIMAFIIGLLFLASGIINYGYDAFTKNMSIDGQATFSKMMRPNQVSFALMYIGVGILNILACVVTNKRIKNSTEQSEAQKQKMVFIMQLVGGIAFLLFGIFAVVSGLQPY